MMCNDGMDDLCRLTVFACQVGTDHGMRTFDFMVDRLADVVQQSRALGGLDVKP